MKPSLLLKLETLCDRQQEIAGLLAEPEVQSNQNRFRELSQEYTQLDPVVNCYNEHVAILDEISEHQEIIDDGGDKELAELANEEISELKQRQKTLESELQLHLLPKDPNDTHNIFLEIRAGTGGAEAAIFAGNLFRMYQRYGEQKRWSMEIMSENIGEHGGYKEVIVRVSGNNVFGALKFESGAHRVQRVPETESQGRIHTSACTVAVLPEVELAEEADINPSELRVDTYRASGAGGQHVNKTDSAVRLTHLPSGIVVECQDERSQHKNKARAMSLLKAKLVAVERDKQLSEQASTRKSLVGSGDRSERIRTYNFPQGRVTDHRINLTLYKLDEVLHGDLDAILTPMNQEYQAEQLAALAE